MLQMLFAILDNYFEGRRMGELGTKICACMGVFISWAGYMSLGMALVMVSGVLYLLQACLTLYDIYVKKQKSQLRYSVTLPFQTVIVGISLAQLTASGLMPLLLDNSLAVWGVYLALLSVFTMGMLPAWIRRVD